jgi:hypothetical protein
MLYTWRIDKKSKYAYMPTREGFFVTEQQRDHEHSHMNLADSSLSRRTLMRKPICGVRDVRTEIGLQIGNAGSKAQDWTNPQVPFIHFVVSCQYPSEEEL